MTLLLSIAQKQNNPNKNLWIGTISEENHDYSNDEFKEPIMRWDGSRNMLKQIELHFTNIEEAKIYAAKYKYKLIINESEVVILPEKRKSYVDNFKK